MTPGPLDFRTIVERMENLETQNRRLRYAGLGIGLVILAILLMGQAKPLPEVIEARAFVVRGETGKERARLGATEDGVSVLELFDAAENRRIDLRAKEEGGGLGIFDTAGNMRTTLLETDKGPGLLLIDSEGNRRVGLVATEEAAIIGLSDVAGNLRLGLTAMEKRADITLYDPAGKKLFSVP